MPIHKPQSTAQLWHVVECLSLFLKDEFAFERAEDGLNTRLVFLGSQDI